MSQVQAQPQPQRQRRKCDEKSNGKNITPQQHKHSRRKHHRRKKKHKTNENKNETKRNDNASLNNVISNESNESNETSNSNESKSSKNSKRSMSNNSHNSTQSNTSNNSNNSKNSNNSNNSKTSGGKIEITQDDDSNAVIHKGIVGDANNVVIISSNQDNDNCFNNNDNNNENKDGSGNEHGSSDNKDKDQNENPMYATNVTRATGTTSTARTTIASPLIFHANFGANGSGNQISWNGQTATIIPANGGYFGLNGVTMNPQAINGVSNTIVVNGNNIAPGDVPVLTRSRPSTNDGKNNMNENTSKNKNVNKNGNKNVPGAASQVESEQQEPLRTNIDDS